MKKTTYITELYVLNPSNLMDYLKLYNLLQNNVRNLTLLEHGNMLAVYKEK